MQAQTMTGNLLLDFPLLVIALLRVLVGAATYFKLITC